MDLDAYVAEHRGEWRRLDALTRKVKPTPVEVDELVLLYQRVATQLSVVRSRTPDPSLIAELSRLVLAARAALTGPPRFQWRTVTDYLTRDLPLLMYVSWRWWVGVAIAFSVVSGVIMSWVSGDPEVAHAFMDPEQIEELVSNDFEAYYHQFTPLTFGLALWTHNAWIAAQCLAAGVLILPVAWLLWQNALNIGIVGGIMIGHDRGPLFFQLIAPHGLLELTGIFVAAGIGLRIGWSWIVPGPVRTRGQSLAAAARQGMLGAVGLVGLFGVSALLEAFVTPSSLPLLMRDAVGLAVWLCFGGYVFILGRAAARDESQLAGGLESEVGVGDLAGKGVRGAVQHGD